VVTVGTGGAAEAVAAFGPTRTIGNTCSFAYSATSSGGQTRGVMGCDSAKGTELVLFRGNGASAYTRIRTGVLGRPLAFADDGTSYYAVYVAPTSSSRTVVKLLKRNRRTGTVTIRTLVDEPDAVVHASIVATGGRYWAAVSLADGAGRLRTHTRQTLDPALPAMPVAPVWQPVLALRGTKRVTMVASDSVLSSSQSVVRYLPQAGGTWKRSTIRADVGFRPTVQYSGGVTRIAWLEPVNEFGVYRVVYADDSSGRFSRRTLPGPAASGYSRPFIAVTAGKVAVAWTARNGGPRPLEWTRAGVAQRVNGSWTSRTVDHGLSAASVGGLGGWNGRLITVMSGSSTGVTKVTSRRQP